MFGSDAREIEPGSSVLSGEYIYPSRRLNRFGDPGEVGRGAAGDGQGDDFGDVVAMQALHLGFQFGETRLGSLDDEQEFFRGFYFSLPAVN